MNRLKKSSSKFHKFYRLFHEYMLVHISKFSYSIMPQYNTEFSVNFFPRLSFPFIFPSAIISFPFYVYEILQYMYVPFLHYWWFYHSLSWSSTPPPLLHQCRHPSRCPSAATERSFQSLTCLYKYTPSPPPSKPHCALITIAHRESWGGGDNARKTLGARSKGGGGLRALPQYV